MPCLDTKSGSVFLRKSKSKATAPAGRGIDTLGDCQSREPRTVDSQQSCSMSTIELPVSCQDKALNSLCICSPLKGPLCSQKVSSCVSEEMKASIANVQRPVRSDLLQWKMCQAMPTGTHAVFCTCGCPTLDIPKRIATHF
eukprot:137332-Amphidinium_carterae.1